MNDNGTQEGQRRPAEKVRSLLAASARTRVFGALALVAMLWLATAWALV